MKRGCEERERERERDTQLLLEKERDCQLVYTCTNTMISIHTILGIMKQWLVCEYNLKWSNSHVGLIPAN